MARDFGFAPNPFHGVCTLATCKPRIRRTAQNDDWIFGMGGSKLNAAGRCIYAMRVSNALTFDEYWVAPEYRAKRPVRNGSRKTIVGDNIYYRIPDSELWHQEDSHHSQPNGTPDQYNIRHDTQTDRVLISEQFVYFGASAPAVPVDILNAMDYYNAIGHRVYSLDDAKPLLSWLHAEFGKQINRVLGDPFQFTRSSARYSKKTDRIT